MHIPVLLQECLAVLDPKPGEFFIDGTLGGGGHAREIISKINPGGTFLAVDRDQRAVEAFNQLELPKSVRVVTETASYAQLPEILKRQSLPKADGLLLDLGFSSEQISGGSLANRGFSFTADEPLIMTYGDDTPSLAQRLADLAENDLESIIREYGEERYAQQIAKSIAQMAKEKGIATTGQLVTAIRSAVPVNYEQGRLHPATRTFQALRIYVNDELRQLEQLLDSLPQIIQSGGRVAIISFHSLEDRIVKQHFRQFRDRSRGSVEGRDHGRRVLAGELPNSTPASNAGTKKPITATEEEISINPRSRSAKLRVMTL